MNFFIYILKCLRIRQLDIIRKTKTGFKRRSPERYQNLSEEEKHKKREYGCKRYKNLSENEKQKLAQYRKIYCKMQNSQNLL